MGLGKRLAVAGALLWSLSAALAFAADPSGATQEWRSIETPHYSVLSQLGERETRAWAADFDVFIDSLGGMLGARQADLPPLTVVLFSPDGAAHAGCAVRRGTWGLTGVASRGAGDDTARRSMLRAGVHWLASSTQAARPAWLETGLAEMFSTFDVRGGHVRWGGPMPDHVALLRERGLIPLREFLQHPEALRAGDAGRFTAQAWALTRLLFFGGQPERRERFAAWLRQRASQPGEATFSAAFLGDVDLMQQDLQAYVDQPSAAYGMTPRGMVEHKYLMTVASRSQVEAALGRLDTGRLEPPLAATSP